MAQHDDDDDGWAKLDSSPEAREERRAGYMATIELRRRLLRWTYAGLGILLIIVILLAIFR